MGIAAAIGVFVLDYNTLISMKILERGRYGDPDLEVFSDVSDTDTEENTLNNIQAHPHVAAATPLFFTSLTSVEPDGITFEITGLEPNASAQFRAYYVRDGGRDLMPGDGPVIILTEKAARLAGLSIGDSIRFSEAPDMAFTIIGLTANWKLGLRNNGFVGFVPFSFGRELFTSQIKTLTYWVRHNGPLTVESLQAILPFGNRAAMPAYRLAGETGDDKVMRDGFRVGGLMTLMLGLYMVFTSLSIALAERIREVGLMQAVGVTDRQIAAVVLIEAVVMALVGAVLGLLGGIALTYVLMKLGYSSLGLSIRVWTFRIPEWRLFFILLLGVIVSLSGAVYPLVKSRRITPVDALQQRGLHHSVAFSKRLYMGVVLILFPGIPTGYMLIGELLHMPWQPALYLICVAAFLLAALVSVVFLSPKLTGGLIRLAASPVSSLFSCEHMLTTRTAAHATERIAMSLGTLALVFAGVLGLKHMTGSLKMQSQAWAEQALQQRFFITTPLLKQSAYNRFNYLPGVQQAIPMSFIAYAPFQIRGLPDNAFLTGPLSDDRERYQKIIDTPALLVSRQFAYRYGIAAGDSITALTSDGPVQLPVLMVTDAYGYFIDSSDRNYAVMALGRMEQLFSIDTSAASQFTLVLDRDADEEQVRNEAFGWFGGDIKELITGTQKYEWAVKGVDDDFFVFEILLAITGLLAGLGVTNTLLIGAMERRREFALLQALGVTPFQLYRIVLFEGLIIGIAGGGLAVVFGLPISWIIVEGLRLLSDLPLEFTPEPVWIAAGFFAAVLVATGAGLYPAWKTLQVPVTESVKYE